MCDRGILDEAFIGGAFKGVDKREIADQSLFNGHKDDLIPEKMRSTFITSVRLYEIEGVLSPEDTEKALRVKTYGDVRDLVDEFNPKRLKYLNK